jgi:hypothetical protein
MEKESTEAETPQAQAVLNCIDLSNPNIDESVYLLKQVLYCTVLFPCSVLFCLEENSHNFFAPILNLLHLVNVKVLHRFWVFLRYQSWNKPGVYG